MNPIMLYAGSRPQCNAPMRSRLTVLITQNFWPFMLAGLKLWPFVSVLNFTVVPANQRLLVGNLFGVVWGVYLSLMAA